MIGRPPKYSRAYVIALLEVYGKLGATMTARRMEISADTVHHCLKRAREMGLTVPTPPRLSSEQRVVAKRARDRERRARNREHEREERRSVASAAGPAKWQPWEDAIAERCCSDGLGDSVPRIASATGRTQDAVRQHLRRRKNGPDVVGVLPEVEQLRAFAVRGKNVDTRGLLYALLSMPRRKKAA